MYALSDPVDPGSDPAHSARLHRMRFVTGLPACLLTLCTWCRDAFSHTFGESRPLAILRVVVTNSARLPPLTFDTHGDHARARTLELGWHHELDSPRSVPASPHHGMGCVRVCSQLKTHSWLLYETLPGLCWCSGTERREHYFLGSNDDLRDRSHSCRK